MNLAQKFDKISSKVDKIVSNLVFILIVSMITAITLQILCRVFFTSLTWSEELSRYLLVWSTFLGATMAYRRGMHIAVTFVVDTTNGMSKKAIQILAIIFSMVFFIIAIYFGINYMQLQTFQVSAALRIPMIYVYTVMPLSFSIMMIHGISHMLFVIYGKEEVEAK